DEEAFLALEPAIERPDGDAGQVADGFDRQVVECGPANDLPTRIDHGQGASETALLAGGGDLGQTTLVDPAPQLLQPLAVDDHMRTCVAGVFAAGDCAESVHRVSGKPVWLPLGDVANRHGRVAGTNMAGGDSGFRGVLRTAIFST